MHDDTLNPIQRPRRLRQSAVLRQAVAETDVPRRALVQPHFVLDREHGREPIDALPGIERQGLEELLRTVEQDLELGLRSVLLFGLATPSNMDATGSAGARPVGSALRAARRLEQTFGDDLLVMADVCLCPFTDHGHCGVLAGAQIDNDRTLPLLAEQAVSLARAGADVVAPSDMMDGRVGAIRKALDAAGFSNTAILAYAVKYASAYYGPFREAAHSAPTFGDRRSHQMDPHNAREALREVALDESEGADLIMVKPALAYLDVIWRVRQATRLPVVAYNVSGEYAMVKQMARAGLADEAALLLENLGAMRRAGADLVITYHGRQAAREGWL
jgi:porphobilinogen synthase